MHWGKYSPFLIFSLCSLCPLWLSNWQPAALDKE
jgi:hypothetical protein